MNSLRAPATLVARTGDVSHRTISIGLGFGALAVAFAATGWSINAASQDAIPAGGMQPAELNALEVLYNHPNDPSAFQDYLRNTHLPLVLKVPGMQHAIIHSGMVTPESLPGDVYQMGTVVFGSQADLQSALGSPEGQAALADVANFATGGFSAYLAHFEMMTFTDSATP